MSEITDIYRRLAAEFPAQAVRRKNVRGQAIPYITARHAVNRLDETVGPERWSETTEIIEQGPRGNTYCAVARCTLEIRVGDHVISRVDVGGASNPDPLVALKGAYSDALKRAAVKHGIGRYLYGDGIPDYEWDEIVAIEGHTPDDGPEAAEPSRPADRDRPRDDQPRDDRPRTGRALFAWLKGLEDSGHKGLVRLAQDHVASAHGPDVRLVDLRPEHVADVVALVGRRLAGEPDPGPERGRPSKADAQRLSDWLNELANDARVEYWQLLTHCLKWAKEQGWYEPPNGKYPAPKDRLEALHQATRDHVDALDAEARRYCHEHNGW